MKYEYIGVSNIKVSKLCLGTMTFGEQIHNEQAFKLLDHAIEQGVNFIDLAEMYPVPTRSETQGRSEEIVGDWLKLNHSRTKVVISAKMAGPGEWISHIRNGKSKFIEKDIITSIEGCLRRLNTDYIDLFQLHWPERPVNQFGRREYEYNDVQYTSFEETLYALDKIISMGKIGTIGVSNETPWGIMKYLTISEKLKLPRIQTIQNVYNLLNRSFEIGHSEICHREKLSLISYSPLAFGVLTGKYNGSVLPTGSRLANFKQMNRYSSRLALVAAEKYVNLAKSYGISSAKMSLSYILSKPFILSCIIGVTNETQLIENLEALNLTLDENIIASIEQIHNEHANPVS